MKAFVAPALKRYNNAMKKYIPILLLLAGCGEKLPNTYEVYKEQPTMQIKKLHSSDREQLYSDIIQQHHALNGITNKQLSACLEDMMGEDSGFAIFSKMVEKCAARYKNNPESFYNN